MRITPFVIATLLAAGTLAGCAPAPGQPGMLQTQSGRALAGAAAGALIADNQDENLAAGAALGALAGAVSCGIPGLPACEGI